MSVVLRTTVPDDLAARVCAVMEAETRNESNLIERLIREGLPAHEKPERILISNTYRRKRQAEPEAK